MVRREDSVISSNIGTLYCNFLQLSMKESIRDILFKELKKRGVTVYKFAKDTGIPKERVYKWEQKKGAPKEDDAALIRKWIGENVTTLVEVGKEAPGDHCRLL